MAETPLFIAQNRDEILCFVPAFATRPRVIYTPGANGSRITGISIASTDAGANTLQIGIARRLTNQEDMGTGAFVDGGASADSITRTTGSFLTDGWKVGDRLLAIDSQTLANDFEAILTAVASTTLQFATGTVAAAEELIAGGGLARLGRFWRLAVPAGAGSSAVAVSGLDTTQAPFLNASPDRLLELGPDDLLIAAVGTTMDTGETLDVTVLGADY